MQLYTVLVVDDESYIVGSVAALLQCQHQWNMEVYRAFSGEEALSILTTTRIDILLADIRMPGMSGLELVKRTRTLWPECMAMLLTAYDDFGSAYEAIHVGVKAFLLKTESDERLLEEVGRIVALLEEKRTQALELPPNAFQRGGFFIYWALIRANFGSSARWRRTRKSISLPWNGWFGIRSRIGRKPLPPVILTAICFC